MGEFGLLAELHPEESAPAACAAGLFSFFFLPILPQLSDSFRPCQSVLSRDLKGNKTVWTSLGATAGTNFDGRLENLTVL